MLHSSYVTFFSPSSSSANRALVRLADVDPPHFPHPLRCHSDRELALVASDIETQHAVQTPAKMFVNHTFDHSQPALVHGPHLERKFELPTPRFTQVKFVKPGAKLLEPFERVRARHPGGSLEVRHLRHSRILAPMRVRSRLCGISLARRF